MNEEEKSYGHAAATYASIVVLTEGDSSFSDEKKKKYYRDTANRAIEKHGEGIIPFLSQALKDSLPKGDAD